MRPSGSLIAAPLLGTLAMAGGLLAYTAALRCAQRDSACPSRHVEGPPVELRVKLAYSGASVQALVGAQHVFTHLPDELEASDPRLRWMRMTVPASLAEATLADLRRDPNVTKAFVAPEVVLAKYGNDLPNERPFPPGRPFPPDLIAESHLSNRPSDDEACPITTPSFESYQGYLGPAPAGIDAPAAWRRGYRGAGIWFADVEGNWNKAHEDLPGDRIEMVAGQPVRDRSWEAHGTAVLGEVVGRDNGKGVVGIAPDVERVFTASLLRTDGGVDVADAIDTAANKMRAGDVLLIELQSAGPRNRYIPVEYWDDVFDAIKAATDRGVIIIEAAGNGYENLDHAIYEGAFDRKVRDSGAIMIGAGGPARAGFEDRAKLDFSNYGARVDVQGWGRRVATLDYGDLQACDGDERKLTDRDYTDEFSGTSSASPIVAGAAVILQGLAKQRYDQPLPPEQLRRLLRDTGTPQAGDTSKNIGPRPDLARAIEALLNLEDACMP